MSAIKRHVEALIQEIADKNNINYDDLMDIFNTFNELGMIIPETILEENLITAYRFVEAYKMVKGE